LLIENGVLGLGFWFWLEISSWGLGLGFSLVCSLWVFLTALCVCDCLKGRFLASRKKKSAAKIEVYKHLQ
jgi:hypothetical protein